MVKPTNNVPCYRQSGRDAPFSLQEWRRCRVSCTRWVAPLLLLGLLVVVPEARADSGGDYPTATRAEYVFACMATNGGNQEALQHCSCAIDVIASILPYDKYEQAETVMRMRRSAGGYLGQEFRTALSNEMMQKFEEAQAEAEVRCF